MKYSIFALIVAVVVVVASSATAQTYVGYMQATPAPVAAYYATGPVAAYSPVVATAYYAPPAAYYPAPVPYYAASPVVAPVPAPYYAAAPVAVAPVYYGPAVVVRPKVYVRGEPVRNVLRAVTP
jgi:hypothetical protein